MIRYWSRWWWKKSTRLQEIIHIWDILSFSLVQSAASAIKSNASTRRTINYGAEPCCVPCQRKTDCTTAGVVQKSPLTRHWKKTRPRGQGDFPSKCCHQQSFLLLFAKKKTTYKSCCGFVQVCLTLPRWLYHPDYPASRRKSKNRGGNANTWGEEETVFQLAPNQSAAPRRLRAACLDK